MSVVDLSVARPALRVLIGQLTITATIVGVALLMWGPKVALSLLVGGGIGIVATAYMAYAMFKPATDRSAGSATRRFFVGWVVKVLLTITLLVIAFRSRSVAPLPLILGYAATYAAYLWTVAQRRP